MENLHLLADVVIAESNAPKSPKDVIGHSTNRNTATDDSRNEEEKPHLTRKRKGKRKLMSDDSIDINLPSHETLHDEIQTIFGQTKFSEFKSKREYFGIIVFHLEAKFDIDQCYRSFLRRLAKREYEQFCSGSNK